MPTTWVYYTVFTMVWCLFYFQCLSYFSQAKRVIQYNPIAAQTSIDWVWRFSHQIEILFTSYADLYLLEVVTAILQH